jgi:hypothetical protein
MEMVKNPSDEESQPPGGRAAKRLKMFQEARQGKQPEQKDKDEQRDSDKPAKKEKSHAKTKKRKV